MKLGGIVGGSCTLVPLFSSLILVCIPTITGLSDRELDICRDLGFYLNNDLTTVKFKGITEDLLQLVIYCSIIPELWCRAQFNGNCACVPKNDTCTSFTDNNFPENTSLDKRSISLPITLSEFRESYAGSFIACATDRSIHRIYHISTTYNKVKTPVSDKSEIRQAAINTIIICLTSILICVGPCFVLTFVGKWRQEQLRQKSVEDKKDCDNGLPQLKLPSGDSKTNLFFGHRLSVESQATLLSTRNFKRSTSSSVASIYSLNGDFCFKQEKIACGRLAEYWRGVYTGALPCSAEKNSVCVKVSKCAANELADFPKQIPPNDHIINYLLTFPSKADGIVTILEFAKFGDLYSFLCAKKKAMVMNTNEYWSKLGRKVEDCVPICAHATSTPPKLNLSIPEVLDTYVTSKPFNDVLSQPLGELDFLVFAHQIAMGMQHLYLHNVLHKRLTSESVLIFENFVLKIGNFSNCENIVQTDKSSRAPVTERNQAVKRTTSGRPIIKWQAPEVIKNESYSSESDIWSYGMTLWEIVSYGETPFDDVVPRLLLREIEENCYLLKPENCHAEMYNLMRLCWSQKDHRPAFNNILQFIHNCLVSLQPEKHSGRSGKTGVLLHNDSLYMETEV